MVECSANRAVMYVRMSTESQDYSTDHQRAKIREYAAACRMRIIREYVDDGKSGLDIKRRAGLLSLMRDVQSAQPDFSHIIVYDISRWGRFQDIDEAAYHEHTCRRAGIEVVYCGEKFNGESGPYAALLKSMKRVMAAEYSRDLSEKVFIAQSRFTEMGFKQGGHAGYGLRRLALKACGTPRAILQHRESKVAATDRVILVWGPAEEVATVRRIYSLYLHDQLSEGVIVRLLNSERLPSEFGRPWTQHMLKTLLTNVKYCGTLAYNRRSCKLSTPRKHNARDEWIVNATAVDPIIDRAMFDQAQAERARRTHRYSGSELINLLQVCYKKHGMINSKIIAADPTMPDTKMFAREFASLPRAYHAAGLPRSPAFALVETKRKLSARRKELLNCVVKHAQAAGASVGRASKPFILTMNGNLLVRIDVSVCCNPKRGLPYWRLTTEPGIDFIMIERMDSAVLNTIDYLLVPAKDLPPRTIYLKTPNLVHYSASRYSSVGAMFGDVAADLEDAC
ncbi:recombinase family protein [Massilia niastensis]|uniref:recombinase family protein n=1 Tax=Massilia niastensis TaxID=544911 RepID=UPI000368294E|nr:recombinase family protein [Massilia niastensis]